MSLSRRALIASLSATTLSLTAVGCSSKDGSDSKGGSGGSGAAGKAGGAGGTRKIRFGYIADFNGSSLLAIADDQDLWKKAGLSPSISVFTNGPIQIQALGAGDLDFGYIGPGAMWLPASGKAKVIAVDTLTDADRVIARPGITSIEQLAGRKVGVPEGTSGEMILNLALKKAGMTEKDIKKVPMDPSTLVAAFSSGQIDGAGFFYPLVETIKKRVPKLVELAADTDFPDHSFPTAFVSGPKTDPALTAKVVGVLAQANDWRAANKDRAISLAAKMLQVTDAQAGSDAANVQLLTTADLVAKTKDGTVDGWLNGLAEFFVGTGQLAKAPAPSTYYDGAAFVAAAQAAGKATTR
ncbi:aliphatic sulfonate ABC transporter substrate-binding protein [Actinacidiphila paucisporea]|uniref:NitT/TauT family transport system substrate-binding protein n=1 Tax=Actinacidiphila paucisporea TaxID=310782 RepID=A0A1M7PER4_9ACTN|nr:aliphatic sulfonate ABC transporter substrate-binding protein [Actinacidiphila paucisporea]SHN15451.1 NitT/TauT family transport system substrate-binding protein [Actinacidiphila paucisporea]